MTAVGQAIDLNLDLQLYYQLVHPLTTTVIAPMLVLIILNYFIVARVAARRVRRVSSRVTRYFFYRSIFLETQSKEKCGIVMHKARRT